MIQDLAKMFSMPNADNARDRFNSPMTQAALALLSNHGTLKRQRGAFEGVGPAMQRGFDYQEQQELKAEQKAQENKTAQYLQVKDPEAWEMYQATGDLMGAWNFSVQKQLKGPAERKTAKDANGRLRYLDDQSYAFDNVEAQPNNKEAFGNERDLRKDYYGASDVKQYQLIRNAYERVRENALTQSGPGDIGLIFAFMKMQDPTSVVRESEFATAENAGGVGESMRNLYNRVLNGERLSPEMKVEFVRAAEQLYSATASNLTNFNDQYGGILDNWQVSRDNVIISPESYEPLQYGDPTAQAGQQPPAPTGNDLNELRKYMTPEEEALFNGGMI